MKTIEKDLKALNKGLKALMKKTEEIDKKIVIILDNQSGSSIPNGPLRHENAGSDMI